MRIPSGVTDQYIYFVAVDATDYTTRETGLSSFTVYRSRNGGAAAAMTTPTINEVDATNMPGVYELLLDEDMTIGAGNDTEEMCFHITHAGMAPVTRTIELYRSKITAGNTLGVAADGDISGNVDGSVNSVTSQVTADVTAVSGDSAAADNLESDYDGTGYDKANSTIGTTTTNTDMRGTDSAALASVCTEARLAELDAANLPSDVDDILTDTGTSIPADIAALNDPTAADVADAVWDEAKAGHVGAGSFGEEVQAHSLSTEISALNDVSSADVQSACDAAVTANTDINNIDTGVNNIEAKLPNNYIMGSSVQTDKDDEIDAILTDTGTSIPALIAALNDITVADIKSGIAEGSLDMEEMLRIILAAVAGKTTNNGARFRDVADSKDRIVVTTDASNNRLTITLDGS